MKFISTICLLFLLPALSRNTRQRYVDLEQNLKNLFKERSDALRQKTKSASDGIEQYLQNLKNAETVPKKVLLKILERSQKQRDEMKSVQLALKKMLDEFTENDKKQQATISFLKMETEKKNKLIKVLQQENKSLKNKLLSGSKLCGIYANESRKIQAQLKELRYRKKDLISKGQQLADLELRLVEAKKELDRAALDKESQLKALKDIVHVCFSSVLSNKPSKIHNISGISFDGFKFSRLANTSAGTSPQHHDKDIPKIVQVAKGKALSYVQPTRKGWFTDCRKEKVSRSCRHTEPLTINNKVPSPDQSPTASWTLH
ncbi:leucine zipper protein 2-like [Paramormyrops kingsleyae]|uniref:leucine zipper protein 2-like n=1 Tax=Paramormyrops kingsleyae TaxID=1676925 RepID=UPI003B9736E5